MNDRIAISREIVNLFANTITQRGTQFPLIWKYPFASLAAKEATREAILARLKDQQSQIMMPSDQEIPSVELQSATDISLTTQERSLYQQAIKIVSDYLAGTEE